MASCRSAHHCLRQSSSTTKRLFSNSTPRRRNGPLTTFPPTSSPELDNIINTLRSNIFFPNHLARVHQQLVYRPTLQHYLTGDEPVAVSLPTTVPSMPSSKEQSPQNKPAPAKPLGNFGPPPPSQTKESMVLQPLDRFTDEPRTRPTLNKLLDLMQTPNDFALLPDLFRELRLAGRDPGPGMVAKTVRKAANKGQVGIAIELFRRTESTGLKINQEEVAKEVMRGAVERVVLGEWEQNVLDKAIKNVEVAWRLMGEPKQRDVRTKTETRDAREVPEVVGAALALVAARATKFGGAKDEDGQVMEWVNRFLKTTGRNEIELDETNWWDCNEKLMQLAPMVVGARLAAKVLGNTPETQELRKTAQLAERTIELAKGALESTLEEGQQRRGLQLSNSLLAQLE